VSVHSRAQPEKLTDLLLPMEASAKRVSTTARVEPADLPQIERGLGGEVEAVEVAHRWEVSDLFRHLEERLGFFAKPKPLTAAPELSL
jgi:hypothetical protein